MGTAFAPCCSRAADPLMPSGYLKISSDAIPTSNHCSNGAGSIVRPVRMTPRWNLNRHQSSANERDADSAPHTKERRLGQPSAKHDGWKPSLLAIAGGNTAAILLA